jgi:hypothetical protein
MPGGQARSARFPAEVTNDGAIRVLAARTALPLGVSLSPGE